MQKPTPPDFLLPESPEFLAVKDLLREGPFFLSFDQIATLLDPFLKRKRPDEKPVRHRAASGRHGRKYALRKELFALSGIPQDKCAQGFFWEEVLLPRPIIGARPLYVSEPTLYEPGSVLDTMKRLDPDAIFSDPFTVWKEGVFEELVEKHIAPRRKAAEGALVPTRLFWSDHRFRHTEEPSVHEQQTLLLVRMLEEAEPAQRSRILTEMLNVNEILLRDGRPICPWSYELMSMTGRRLAADKALVCSRVGWTTDPDQLRKWAQTVEVGLQVRSEIW